MQVAGSAAAIVADPVEDDIVSLEVVASMEKVLTPQVFVATIGVDGEVFSYLTTSFTTPM